MIITRKIQLAGICFIGLTLENVSLYLRANDIDKNASRLGP